MWLWQLKAWGSCRVMSLSHGYLLWPRTGMTPRCPRSSGPRTSAIQPAWSCLIRCGKVDCAEVHDVVLPTSWCEILDHTEAASAALRRAAWRSWAQRGVISCTALRKCKWRREEWHFAHGSQCIQPAAKTYPHPRIPAARLFFAVLCFSVLSSTPGSPEANYVLCI